MAPKNRYAYKPQKQRTRHVPDLAPVATAEPRIKKADIEYGKPYILLEDINKDVFEYKGGAWVAHPRTISECRVDCQVKELPQKVNKMTRYEVRSPV
jgi:hypothetical protein